MVALQVRDVSERSRDSLAAEADRRGQSLQVFLHEVIEREAASARNIAWVLSKRSAKPPSGPSTTRDEIRRLNDEHTDRILAAFDERHG